MPLAGGFDLQLLNSIAPSLREGFEIVKQLPGRAWTPAGWKSHLKLEVENNSDKQHLFSDFASSQSAQNRNLSFHC